MILEGPGLFGEVRGTGRIDFHLVLSKSDHRRPRNKQKYVGQVFFEMLSKNFGAPVTSYILLSNCRCLGTRFCWIGRYFVRPGWPSDLIGCPWGLARWPSDQAGPTNEPMNIMGAPKKDVFFSLKSWWRTLSVQKGRLNSIFIWLLPQVVVWWTIRVMG